MGKQTDRQTEKSTCLCLSAWVVFCLSLWLVSWLCDEHWCYWLTNTLTVWSLTDWLSTCIYLSLFHLSAWICLSLFLLDHRFTGLISTWVPNCFIDPVYIYNTLWQLLETPNTLTGFFTLEISNTKAVSIGNDFGSSHLCLSHCALWLPRPNVHDIQSVSESQ